MFCCSRKGAPPVMRQSSPCHGTICLLSSDNLPPVMRQSASCHGTICLLSLDTTRDTFSLCLMSFSGHFKKVSCARHWLALEQVKQVDGLPQRLSSHTFYHLLEPCRESLDNMYQCHLCLLSRLETGDEAP